MRGHSMRGNRETPSASVGNLTRRTRSAGACAACRSGKTGGRNPDVHAGGESDIGVVPKRTPNDVGPPAGPKPLRRDEGPRRRRRRRRKGR
jgi:hypothetical protein